MKTAYITGVPGALATSVRAAFLAAGWSVAGFGRRLDDFAASHYEGFVMNALVESDVERAFADAQEKVGAPDALIATIGGVRSWKALAETSLEDFQALLDLNLKTFFLTARESMRRMNPGGTIISIGASAVQSPSANRGAYAASKAGVVTLTKVLAREGIVRGITANVLVPTIIRTSANESWGSPDEIPKWTAPDDVSQLCLHLCSVAGHSINGAVIEMPGGM